MKELYGVLAEFETPEQLLAAVQKTRASGFKKIEAYSPFPIHGLAEALGFNRSRLPTVVFFGGLTGMCTAYFMQWFASTIHYPLIVAGKPFHSWPAFIPITFELTVLFAAITAVIGMLAMNGLPRPHHPLFDVPEFEGASRDRFFLCIETGGDKHFDRAGARSFLEDLHPLTVHEVEE